LAGIKLPWSQEPIEDIHQSNYVPTLKTDDSSPDPLVLYPWLSAPPSRMVWLCR